MTTTCQPVLMYALGYGVYPVTAFENMNTALNTIRDIEIDVSIEKPGDGERILRPGGSFDEWEKKQSAQKDFATACFDSAYFGADPPDIYFLIRTNNELGIISVDE